ncbi:hypothetical protein BGP_6542 [Beggiatoa sp. PS]|nr:hypothetical protein BGP_6542 [Beggiatoa sp. PS]
MASASALASPEGTSIPDTSFSIKSVKPPTFEQITGISNAIASAGTRPNPSNSDGITQRLDACNVCINS